jgi:hypothetical protein
MRRIEIGIMKDGGWRMADRLLEPIEIIARGQFDRGALKALVPGDLKLGLDDHRDRAYPPITAWNNSLSEVGEAVRKSPLLARP